MKLNVIDIVIIFILVVAIIVAIITIRRNKGRCAYCNHYDSCPFKKVIKDVK